MRLTVVPRVALHLQYQTVRLPIGVIDTQVLGRYLSAVSRIAPEVTLVLLDRSLDTRSTGMR